MMQAFIHNVIIITIHTCGLALTVGGGCFVLGATIYYLKQQ